MLATISRDVLFWDTAARKRVRSVHPFSHPSHLDFSPDGQRLAVKSTSGRIVVLDAHTGDTVIDYANQRDGEGAPLYFAARGNALIDASWGGSLMVRDLARSELKFHERVGGMVSELSASEDRSVFAYTIGRRPPSDSSPPPEDLIVLRRWPFGRNRPCILPVSRPFITVLSLSPSASRIAVLYGAPPDALEIIDLSTADILAYARVDLGGSGSSVAWSPDESVLGCVERHRISLFEASSLRRTHMIPLRYPSAVTFSADGGLLGLASWEQGRILDIADLQTFELHANAA